MEQVYIFDFGEKLKIGYSTNASQRLKTIESASGAKAKRTYTVSANRQVEQAAHHYLRQYHIQGEYFNCDFETAKQAVNGIIHDEIVVNPNEKHIEARKRAARKWDSENMTTLGCKVKKEQAETFKAYCARQGKTANTVLRDYVLDCIGEKEAGGE